MRMRGLVIVLLVGALPSLLAQDQQEIGRPGGRLVVALRAEPRTLNPMQATGDLGTFRPAVLDTSGLWNADQLFLRPRAALQRTSR